MEDNVTPDAIHIPHANICLLFLSPTGTRSLFPHVARPTHAANNPSPQPVSSLGNNYFLQTYEM